MTAASPALTVPNFEGGPRRLPAYRFSEGSRPPARRPETADRTKAQKMLTRSVGAALRPRKPRKIKGRIAAAFFIHVTARYYFLRGTFGTALAFFGASLTSAFAFLAAVFLAFAFVFSSPSSSSSVSG
jgi:hypothetical protein